MNTPIQCPSCFSMNKPDQTQCQVCGRKLPEDRGGRPVRAVYLQKVMGGEVFAAVLGNPTKPAPAEVAPAAAPPEPVTVPPNGEEEGRRALSALSERISRTASSAGQRFKPYSAARPRNPETAEAKAVVLRQLESAAKAFRGKRYENAIEHLLKAIAKDDRDPRSWTLLGEAYLRLGRPYKAAVGYLQALEIEPRRESAWLGLSRTLKSIQDFPGALEVLDRTVQINPNLPEAWSERGLVLEALDDAAEAVKSFTRALELRPDHKVARERYEQLAPKVIEAIAEPAPEPSVPTTVPDEASSEEEEFPDFEDLAKAPAPQAPAQAAPKEKAPRPARIRTYIEGLDETIGGGIPWGHVVLVEGSPGTMKSSVGFSILLNNAAKDGMHGLYLSLEERTSSLLKQMGSLGLHFHVDRGSLVVLDPRAAKGLLDDRADWIDAFQTAVTTIKGQRGLDLVVIDSLEALEVLAKFKDRRREIFRLFEWLRDLDVTSFVVTERPDWVIGGHVIQGRWDEDFLADGVVHMRQHLVSDLEVQRRLRVVKMRGTKHETGYMALVLDEGRFKVTRAMSP